MRRNKYTVHHLDDYTVFALTEPPASLAELRAQLDLALREHPFGKPLAVILTTRSFKLSQRVLRRVADEVHRYGICFGNRVALVTYRSMEFGAGMILGCLLKHHEVDLRPFLTLEDADAWLRHSAEDQEAELRPHQRRGSGSHSDHRSTVPTVG